MPDEPTSRIRSTIRPLQPGVIVRVHDDALQLGQTVRVCATVLTFDQDGNETHTVELERVED